MSVLDKAAIIAELRRKRDAYTGSDVDLALGDLLNEIAGGMYKGARSNSALAERKRIIAKVREHRDKLDAAAKMYSDASAHGPYERASGGADALDNLVDELERGE